MQVKFYGHAAFEISTGDTSILIDPFISDNPLTDTLIEDLKPSHIILTHAHGDHIGDTEAIAQSSGAVIISSFEIVNYYTAKGFTGHPMNPGGAYTFPFGKVQFTPAWHSSSFPDGSYGGMPMGVVIEAEGKRIYHAGDTALFSDMALIGRQPLDLALLPIGDNFTMGPEDAAEAVNLLKPRQVVPIHYNTFGLIEQDPQAFKQKVEQNAPATVTILEAGGMLEL